jgi:hypothetical protein
VSVVSVTCLSAVLRGVQKLRVINAFGGSSGSGGVVVKALCYKLEGRGFETRWGEFLNLPNPSCPIRPWDLLSL